MRLAFVQSFKTLCFVNVSRNVQYLVLSIDVFVQMALSAASPFYRGFVSDIDCRWGVISASVDDRTREERGLEVRTGSYASFNLHTNKTKVLWPCS